MPTYANMLVIFRLLVLITRIGHQISEETFSEVSSVIEQVK
jgi:hypothetical protein